MAEALAIIGFTFAIVQFIDFGSKVVRQLRRLAADTADMPHTVVFRNVRTPLPVMLDVVRKMLLQLDAGRLKLFPQETVFPVIKSRVQQAEQLDSLIARPLPQKNESSWPRGKKAGIDVLVESDVEKLYIALKANFDLLAQVGTFSLVSSFAPARRESPHGQPASQTRQPSST